MRPPSSNKPPRVPKSGLTSDFLTLVINGGVVVILIVGIAGLLYKTFKPGGWFSRFVGGALDGGADSIAVAIAGVLLAGFLIRRWFDSVGSESKRGDLLLYLALALGVYILLEWFITGSI